jgi:hypothetical protein
LERFELVAVSQPFDEFESQSPQPEAHSMLQTPAVQTGVPWVEGQMISQPPQLSVLVAVFVSQPLPGSPSQSA